MTESRPKATERAREAERTAVSPRDLPTAVSPATAIALRSSFVRKSPKVVEGLTRKAAAVEIYPSGMLLLARLVTRKSKPAFPVLLFPRGPSPPSPSPVQQGFIGRAGINDDDMLLFSRQRFFRYRHPFAANVRATSIDSRRVCFRSTGGMVLLFLCRKCPNTCGRFVTVRRTTAIV